MNSKPVLKQNKINLTKSQFIDLIKSIHCQEEREWMQVSKKGWAFQDLVRKKNIVGVQGSYNPGIAMDSKPILLKYYFAEKKVIIDCYPFTSTEINDFVKLKQFLSAT